MEPTQINKPVLADPTDEDLEVRQAVLVVRSMVTVYLSIVLVTNSILYVGVAKRIPKLFFPHFLVTPFMIALAISCTVYCILAPGQATFATTGVAFALMETLFLYATVSYYKHLKGLQSWHPEPPKTI